MKISIKQFILRQGATCNSWRCRWSFINAEDRVIIFGAWNNHTVDNETVILSENWEFNHKGRKNAAYKQSREHIRLVEEEGYILKTFPQVHSDEKHDASGYGVATIKDFTLILTVKHLKKRGKDWVAY